MRHSGLGEAALRYARTQIYLPRKGKGVSGGGGEGCCAEKVSPFQGERQRSGLTERCARHELWTYIGAVLAQHAQTASPALFRLVTQNKAAARTVKSGPRLALQFVLLRSKRWAERKAGERQSAMWRTMPCLASLINSSMMSISSLMGICSGMRSTASSRLKLPV